MNTYISLEVSDRKLQKEKSTSKEEGNWNRKLRMETFSNNRVTKNNSIAKLRQFSLWARKDTNRVVSRANYFWKTGEHPKSEAPK